MDKVYKIKKPLIWVLAHSVFSIGIFINQIYDIYRGGVSYEILITRMIFILILVIELCFYLWYIFSHKFILSYESKEIIEKAWGGIINKKIKVDDIREYYIYSEKDLDYVLAKPIFKSAANAQIIFRLNIAGKEVLKNVSWTISQEDAEKLFSEVKKMNSNIICAESPFYESLAFKSQYKKHKTKYLMVALIIILVLFFAAFFYILNTSLNPSF